jgi:hypothetical protein
MQRRRFLVEAPTVAALMPLPSVAWGAAKDKTVSCAVAGVSFSGFDVSRVHERSPVVVRCETHEGMRCYRILDQDGATIGFVPRAELRHFARREVKKAWLSKVNPYAVPWKQLEVTLLLT